MLSWHEVDAITDIPTTANDCMFIFESNYGGYDQITVPYATLDLNLTYIVFAFIWDTSKTYGYAEVKLSKNNIVVETLANGITSVEVFKIYYR